jgi:4-amino-4-deoxy-L-arabinose transferase-like glycosyltransferase
LIDIRSHRLHSLHHLARYYWPWVAVVLAVATALRFIGLATRPAYDWDESNYLEIGRNVAEFGVVTAKTPFGQEPELYFYNPVFYFWLEGGWFKLFGSGILQARWLAAGAAVLMLLMLAGMLRSLLGTWALLAVSLLALDGWMIFTNRVGWIENVGFVFAVGGLWLYKVALDKPTWLRFGAAGLVLAWATVFKHQFGYFIVGVFFCWLIVREHHRKHVVMFGTMVLGAVAYVAAMLLWNADDYRREMGGQLMRLLGKRASRGAVSSLSETITAFQNQYAIYFGMVVALGLAGALVAYRTAQIAWRLVAAWRQSRQAEIGSELDSWRQRWDYAFERVMPYALVYAWALGAFACFGPTMKVRLPHYIFLVIVPAYCYLAAELKQYVERGVWQGGRRFAVAMLAVVVMGSGLYATYQRMSRDDRNAFGEAAVWIKQNVPAGSLIITEEPIGNNTPDDVLYCKMDRAASCEKAGADYLVVYTTLTFKPPDSPAIQRMTKTGQVLATFEDFKAKIVVYRIV